MNALGTILPTAKSEAISERWDQNELAKEVRAWITHYKYVPEMRDNERRHYNGPRIYTTYNRNTGKFISFERRKDGYWYAM